MKNNVKAKAVRLENACLKTGNFVIGANALSKDDLMILELIESAATKRCRDPDSMPGEMVCNENIKYKSQL